MHILAIDPGSYETGLYADGYAETLVLGTPTERKIGRPQRLAHLMDKLTAILAERKPDFVIYEEQFVRGGGATKALFGVVGIIEAVTLKAGAGVMSVPQSTVRKWAKEECERLELAADPERGAKQYAAALAKTGPYPAETEHEMDACCLWLWAQQNCEGDDYGY